MGAKDLGKSFRSGWKSFLRRSAASPPPSPRRPAGMLNPDAVDLTIAEAMRATEEGLNEAHPPDAASLEGATESPSNNAQTRTQSVQRQPADTPRTESIEQQSTALSKSQVLWNAAYDSLEEDKDTAELVFMKKLVEEGQAKISTPSNVTKGVGDVAQFILSAKGMVDAAIQNIPQAALPWAGVCIGLQILLNPAKATKSNLTGIAHVVSRMDWYCALTEHLLNKDYIDRSFQTLLPQLQAKILALYKALLLYQMKSVCSYYRHRGLVFLRGLANWDNWDRDLKTVTDAEATLQRDSAQYNEHHAKRALAQLVVCAKGMEELLGDIYQTLREFLALQKELQLDDIDRQCRWDLRVVDPKDDIKKIANKKDTLLPDAYEWVFGTEQFVRFRRWNDDDLPDQDPCQLLWIKGHAGTGKTMLLIGIIRSLEKWQDFSAPGVSCFFCQGTDATLNNATTALRSLVWMLLVEQPHLVSHLRKKYKDSGAALFRDPNTFFALSEGFLSMLDDPKFSPVLFVVDALDECDKTKPGLDELIQLISNSISRSDKVKWLLSSRPEIDVLAKLKNLNRDSRDISENLVELDAQRLADPVDAYISHKLTTLRSRRGYDKSILAEISDEIRRRAMNTFLWVSLAFKVLETIHGRIEKVEEIDPQDCKRVLVCATLAFRPITLSELAALSDMPHDITVMAIELCGSFLASREETVYLIHQSAKDYLDENFNGRLQPSGIAQGHADIGRRSIDAMSSVLKQNMYDLDYGFKPKDMRPPQPDPLASVRYSCVDRLSLALDCRLDLPRPLPTCGLSMWPTAL
ncbi:WD-repeat protein [Pochonia chlamydosporia 170]|uniref:WD-repeat protein n=1 Tax=Pochonia chlamydosporia 170 TaxID=1380566 RepID=A0A179EYZ6_METCM|nr:WD-repeat protein [Pochonia chlamydosporia 170]OAQ58427.1 WD-repeat protein [Pochonia chlamydosporia 170]